jgi:3-hydroxyisobutyrate dehydrogenase-like beta-hydroxyacid dehydrogenase
MTAMQKKVGILGVGKMGSAMARELVAAGHEVTLWNRSKEKADALVTALESQLVSSVSSAREAIDASEIVICTFTDGKTTQAVLIGDDSTLAGIAPETIIIDMGTSGIDSAKLLSSKLAGLGIAFVDAPVSGSMATIASHQLLVLASGDPKAIAEITPTLMAFSKKVANLGAAGAGQAMKLSVNLIVHSLNAAVSEALALASASGIDPAAAYDVFDESVIAAPFVKYKRSAFLDENTPVAMRMDTVVKDLGLIRGFGLSAGIPLNATWAVEDLYRHACAGGFEAADMASLVRFLKK